MGIMGNTHGVSNDNAPMTAASHIKLPRLCCLSGCEVEPPRDAPVEDAGGATEDCVETEFAAARGGADELDAAGVPAEAAGGLVELGATGAAIAGVVVVATAAAAAIFNAAVRCSRVGGRQV